MLTLNDIDEINPGVAQGYSDLYKDVYGCRPRGSEFSSMEAFEEDYHYLIGALNQQIEEEKDQQAKNWNKFMSRLMEIRSIVKDCSWESAIDILADGEDCLEDMKFYGYEKLEFELHLKYGSIKKFLNDVKECTHG